MLQTFICGINYGQGVPVLLCNGTEAVVINAEPQVLPFFLIKKKPAPAGHVDGQMNQSDKAYLM